jgi:hypothetical protein
MFVGEARSLPYSGAPERCFTHVGSGIMVSSSVTKKKVFRKLTPGSISYNFFAFNLLTSFFKVISFYKRENNGYI